MADDTFSKDCVGECNDKGEAIGAIINWVHSTLISAVNKGTGAVNSIDFFPATRFHKTMFSISLAGCRSVPYMATLMANDCHRVHHKVHHDVHHNLHLGHERLLWQIAHLQRYSRMNFVVSVFPAPDSPENMNVYRLS